LYGGDVGKVVVITGTPGTGKSTVGRLLANKLEATFIELGELVKEEGLYLGIDEETGSLIADLEALSDRLVDMIASSTRPLVVVGHYAQHVVPKEAVLRAFVLRRNPYELMEILKSRGYVSRKLYENLQAEILDVCLYEAIQAYGPELVYEIDTSSREPEEVVEEALRALKKGLSRVGIVDWLGMLERDGRLEEFFSQF